MGRTPPGQKEAGVPPPPTETVAWLTQMPYWADDGRDGAQWSMAAGRGVGGGSRAGRGETGLARTRNFSGTLRRGRRRGLRWTVEALLPTSTSDSVRRLSAAEPPIVVAAGLQGAGGKPHSGVMLVTPDQCDCGPAICRPTVLRTSWRGCRC